MPTVTVHTDEASWLAHRRQKLTSSDCCTLLGLGYGDANPFGLWYEKVHGDTFEMDADRRRRMEAGHHFEALMHRWTEQEIGEELYDLGDYAIVEHDGGILSCTTDRLLVADPAEPWGSHRAIVSFKTADRSAARGYQESKPFAYALTQAHVEMMCCGVDEGLIATSFGLGDAFVVTPIVRNDHMCEVITERAESFWPLVEREEVPPPEYIDESKAIGDALSLIYAGATGEAKVLGEEWGDLLLREQELRAEMKERSDELQKIKNLASRELEGASIGVVPGCPRKVRWAKRSGGGFYVDPWERWGVSFVKA